MLYRNDYAMSPISTHNVISITNLSACCLIRCDLLKSNEATANKLTKTFNHGKTFSHGNRMAANAWYNSYHHELDKQFRKKRSDKVQPGHFASIAIPSVFKCGCHRRWAIPIDSSICRKTSVGKSAGFADQRVTAKSTMAGDGFLGMSGRRLRLRSIRSLESQLKRV